MSAPPTDSGLIVFCGKGGVGKTTLALAFALGRAERGSKVVVVTSHPLTELAVSISLAGLKERYPLAAANLYITYIEAREVLNRRLSAVIPSAMLRKAVLSSRVYQSLIEIAPGLKEIAFLARLRQLAERRTREEDGEIFDLLIWDAPATGHFLQTLKVARNFHTNLSGPFAVLGDQLVQFFDDPSGMIVFPVATLEEMAVEETIDLYRELSNEIHIQPAGIICNMASPLLASSDQEFDDIYRKVTSEESGRQDLKFMLDRHVEERSLFHKLEATVTSPLHIVERAPESGSDLEMLVGISGEVGAAVASRKP